MVACLSSSSLGYWFCWVNHHSRTKGQRAQWRVSTCWGDGIILVAEWGDWLIIGVSPLLSNLVFSSLIGTLRIICVLPKFNRYSKLIENIEPTFCLMYAHCLVFTPRTTIVLIRMASTK